MRTDYKKYIIKKYNGFSLSGTEVLGIDTSFKDRSLDRVYTIERSSSFNRMPQNFLPFSPDGRGNHYCIDLNELDIGVSPVVFWQHDFFILNLLKSKNVLYHSGIGFKK